jgi:hypothetical protein
MLVDSVSNLMQGTDREVTRIGQFKFGPSIGEGTFGLVKIGTHVLTQEKVLLSK